MLAVGILLDDMDDGNGPMMCSPGAIAGRSTTTTRDGAFCGGIDLERTPVDLSGAVALTAPAGSVTIHHARLVHGSGVNRSDRRRRVLFFEYAAADAWPLAGTEPLDDLDEFNRRVVHGSPTLEPRLAPAPVRVPLPKAVHQGSLYENQRTLRRRYFATADEPEQGQGLERGQGQEPDPASAPGYESGHESGRGRPAAAAAD